MSQKKDEPTCLRSGIKYTQGKTTYRKVAPMYGTTNWRIVWVLVVLGLFLSAARGAELVEQAGWLMQGEPAVCGYRVRRGGQAGEACRG